ncbi:type VI secretion system baseplate subunit TssE [Enterobacter hormaechei]|uniref:type VI secretion system baseplate subunit TssE n=1 Tax=Enterobacter cloacae complex TaxID=354276 RepID=UPI0022EC35F4|nr:type VI secretion system baseplate subunit TssE [Enterobacter hormaechei]WBT21683.1 type VI secretion system baseplate subunit TssE [Enterobacter hormaechei]
MPKGHNTPSLYEMLSGNFSGGLSLNQVSEQNQVILSVLDNMQRILNCRAGTLAHLPDYGLPDMTKILQGMPGTAHQLITTLSAVLLKYEPRLSRIEELNGSSDVLRNQVIELQTRTRNFRLENEFQTDNALKSREWAVNS